MLGTRVLRSSNLKQLKELPHRETVKLAYDLHLPSVSVQKNIHSNPEEPIVFLHGIFGSKKSYATDSKLIADSTHTPVYTIDLRNHGETQHAQPFNYDTLAQDIKQFCEDHRLSKIKLIGYSLGAKISMLTALRFPELIKSAVIIDNSPVQQPHIELYMKQYVKSMLHVLNESKIRADDKDWKSKASAAMKRFLPNAVIRKNLLVNLVNKPPKDFSSPVIDFDDGYIHFMNPIRHMEEMAIKDVTDWPVDSTDGLKFDGEIKFIRGLKSPFICKDGFEKIQEHFTNNSFTDVNSNHDILDHRPSEYVKIISEFFNHQRYKDAPSKTILGYNPVHMPSEARL